jgi:hypothetical protein
LTHQLATFLLPKNGLCEKERLGTYWKDKDTKLVHFIGKTISFSIASSSSDVESRRKLYFARQRSLQMSS